MVQILPYVQTPLEQLTPHISQAAHRIGYGLGQHYKNQKDATLLEQLRQGEGSPIDISTIWGQLSPEARKIHEPLVNSQLRVTEHQQKLEQKQQQKVQAEKLKEQSTREALIPKFQNLQQLIDDQALNVGNIEAQERLNTGGFWITDQVYTHFNKGVISMPKFENMKNDLAPNANLRPSVNRARLKELQLIAGLPEDISKEKFDKILDQSIKKVKSVESKEEKQEIKNNSSEKKGKQLSEELAAQIFQEAGEDANEARRIARERGYDF